MAAYVKMADDSVKNILHHGWWPARFSVPKLQPAMPLSKSSIANTLVAVNITIIMQYLIIKY